MLFARACVSAAGRPLASAGRKSCESQIPGWALRVTTVIAQFPVSGKAVSQDLASATRCRCPLKQFRACNQPPLLQACHKIVMRILSEPRMTSVFSTIIFVLFFTMVLAMVRVVKQVLPPVALAIWSLWIIGAFGFYTLGTRLWTQLDGVVIAARDIPPTRGPRYATEYTIRGPDGLESQYVAGATDASLARSIPVGTYLRKTRWHVDYERDGRRVADFGLPFYSAVLAIGFGCLSGSILQWRRQRQ